MLPVLIKRQLAESAYRIYMTDCVRIMTENTARFGGGTYIRARYVDVIDPKPQDTRTCEEITEDIVSRCGLVVKE